MKLRELKNLVEDEIKSDNVRKAKNLIKEKVLEIDELEKALSKAKSNLDSLLEMDIEELEYDVW